jgi:Uncharacterized small membrane protein
MAGAFGAHGLRAVVSNPMLEVWQTAAHYQLAHALALLALALAMVVSPPMAASQAALWAARLWLLGSLVFAGSLYSLVLTGIGLFGAITPVGGVLLIAGWCSLLMIKQ